MKQITGNSGMVREVNRERIAQALRDAGVASIAAVARSTGLSIATCSNLMPDLTASGEVLELPAKSRGGRPAKRYAYNPNNSLAALLLLRSVDAKAEVRYSVRNRNGETLTDGKRSFSILTVNDIVEIIRTLMQEHPEIKAAAVSIPGVVHNGEMEFGDIAELTGINIEKQIVEATGLNTVSENDMNFAAIGYHHAHRESSDSALAYLTFPPGDCAGMGLVVNGTLVKGKSDFAGEVSFLPFEGLRTNPVSERIEVLIGKMSFIITSVIAIVNPDAIVVTGKAISKESLETVRERCLTWIPERHMPDIILRCDYEEDSLAGMAASAFNTLSPSISLVEKGRLWMPAL